MKQLLVEGKKDQYAIASLMANYVAWGDEPKQWPVLIRAEGSVDELLDKATIGGYLKQAELEIIGIVVDADGNPESRWQSIRSILSEFYDAVPELPPQDGLVLPASGLPQFGCWMMPDNQSRGMLETLLSCLVPNAAANPVWQFANECVSRAKTLGATFKDAHIDKARVHTFLAWCDPPGMPLGEAILSAVLDPNNPSALGFARWFIRLFGLAPTKPI